eukprot:3667246-Pleurochrysis_carterae.AAC.3
MLLLLIPPALSAASFSLLPSNLVLATRIRFAGLLFSKASWRRLACAYAAFCSHRPSSLLPLQLPAPLGAAASCLTGRGCIRLCCFLGLLKLPFPARRS